MTCTCSSPPNSTEICTPTNAMKSRFSAASGRLHSQRGSRLGSVGASRSKAGGIDST
ncbi:Uncharacterised protein [Mycobacteroides abscessus subsp. abscessus]|nr:Uncharacterised protein [Mycobacteroides abscessus subsp. abscessus]